MANLLRGLREDALRTRADRVGLVVLAAMVALFAVLALFGMPVGVWGLLFLAGAAVPATLLAATDRSERWRKPAAVSTALLFPAWMVAGLLSLWAPSLEPLLGFSTDFEPGIGAFVRGMAMLGMILGLMRLLGPERGRGR